MNFSSDQTPLLSCLPFLSEKNVSVSSSDRSGEDEFHNIAEKNNNKRNISLHFYWLPREYMKLNELFK